MASFLTRALLLPVGPDLFVDDAGSLHEPDINALASSGITVGCGPSLFCPDAPVTTGSDGGVPPSGSRTATGRTGLDPIRLAASSAAPTIPASFRRAAGTVSTGTSR